MKRLLFSISVFTLFVIPQFVFASDVDEFKSEVERYYQAFNSMDAETIVQMTHPGLVSIESDAPFPFVYPTVDALKEVVQNWFSTLESINFFDINPQYKIVGNTGIVWCISGGRVKPKGGSVEISYVRKTQTWVKSEGKWRVLTEHFSKIPLDDLK